MLSLLHHHLHTDDDTNHLGIILVNLNINFDEESQLNAASAQLMRAAIQKIQEHLNNQATLFRVGPIEIAILIEPLNFVAQLNLIASKLAHAFESALDLDNISLILKPYFGCVSSFNTRHNAFAIYDCARLALHHAMINNYQIELYDQHITASFSNIHQLDEAIIEALQHNELESYLQPIISLPHETCANAELLLRWQSEDWQLVSPVRLIDAIYKKGFGKVFIRWLINTACQHIAELITAHQRSISLTINLSVTDLLDADLPVLLAQSITLWDIPAQNLIIEITEGDILVDEEKAAQVIDQIVALGCKLALDDFGTGYSSMTRLRSMPIDLVKIDQSFVRNIAHSPEDREIVESVVALAHSLGKQVVAEGVEDKACLDILKQLQCEKIQGYYYAKPMSFNEFSTWLTRFSTR
jgi:EAL domain-containing protein (putative c-di-GMP-specific phosphodiesterase class I)/GGDEF domain-containing protein